MPRAAAGTYLLLGICSAAIAALRFIEWVRYWMQKPNVRAKA